jgi:pyrroloquinoline quinone biosynthesis protein B
MRSGTFHGKSRSQTQVAVSPDGATWLLLNASPDLRTQIEATPALHPRKAGRDSPIAAVVLTGADLDQVVGLLSLRELQPFRVHCTPSVKRIMQEDNSVFAMLNRVPDQVSWDDIHSGGVFTFPLENDSGLRCTVFSLGKRYPAYVSAKRAASLEPEEASLGLLLTSQLGTLAYLPTVSAIDDSLLARLETANLLLFDGTFWSDDELIQVQGSGQTARKMGHIPVSGPEGSMRKLAGLRRPRKVFIHVNNTNPMLDESGPEHREMRAAGWEIAEDGWTIDL